MAETKTTRTRKPKTENTAADENVKVNNAVVEEINNEAVEGQQVEEETVAESETVSVEEPAVEETANAEEPAAEETESETEITAEELGNLVKEFENPEETLSEKLADSGDIAQTVKAAIARGT